MFINSLPLLPNSSLICRLEDMREWLPISRSYSTLRLPKSHHTFGANVVITIIKSIALGLSPICIMNMVLYVLAELPVRVSGGFQAVSHKDLPSSYILLLWTPLFMETVQKVTSGTSIHVLRAHCINIISTEKLYSPEPNNREGASL